MNEWLPCSKWSELAGLVLGNQSSWPGPWSLKYHAFMREIMDCTGDFVFVKATQLGGSSVLVVMSFHRLLGWQVNVFYILPTGALAQAFGSTHFGPFLKLSPRISKQFSVNTKLLKETENGSVLMVTGSMGEQILSSPASFIVFDEYDKLTAEAIEEGKQRGAGAANPQYAYISTPKKFGGVMTKYETSTHEHFQFRCFHCSRYQNLDFDSLKIIGESATDPKIDQSYYACKYCGGTLPHELKYQFLAGGLWVPENKNSNLRGFQLPRFYSSAKSGAPGSIAIDYFNSFTSDIANQSWHNNVLAELCTQSSTQIVDDDFHYYEGEIPYPAYPDKVRTCGVDLGEDFSYFTILEWDKSAADDAKAKVADFGKFRFDDFFSTMNYKMNLWQINANMLDISFQSAEVHRFLESVGDDSCYGTKFRNTIEGLEIVEKQTANRIIYYCNRENWCRYTISLVKKGIILLGHQPGIDQFKTMLKNGRPIKENKYDHCFMTTLYAILAKNYYDQLLCGDVGCQRITRRPGRKI